MTAFRTYIRIFAASVSVAVAACGSDGPKPVEPGKPEPPPVPTTPLPTGVFALSGISTSLANTDLEPFRQIVGDALFVALGESTHTSAGYYEAKARLIRFMVEQMGFRVVLMETPWLEALEATRYVASCSGTPENALRGLFVVWRDANVRDLLRWMCEFNRMHTADPVSFLGFDVQEPWRSVPLVRQFISAAAPVELARTDGLLRCLGGSFTSSEDFFRSDSYRDFAAGKRDASAHQQCTAGISQLEAWIAANAATLQRETSATALEEARISLIALRGWEDQLWVPDPGGYEARDHGTADVLRRLHALHTPGKKAVIWAWNWHISRRYEDVRGFDDDPQKLVPRQGARNMGSFLSETLGSRYLPVALIGYRVQINSGGITPPVQDNPLSVERRLHDLGPDYLLVDLRQPLPESFLPTGRTYQISQEWGDPYRQFGALVFLEQSAAMTYVASIAP